MQETVQHYQKAVSEGRISLKMHANTFLALFVVYIVLVALAITKDFFIEKDFLSDFFGGSWVGYLVLFLYVFLFYPVLIASYRLGLASGVSIVAVTLAATTLMLSGDMPFTKIVYYWKPMLYVDRIRYFLHYKKYVFDIFAVIALVAVLIAVRKQQKVIAAAAFTSVSVFSIVYNWLGIKSLYLLIPFTLLFLYQWLLVKHGDITYIELIRLTLLTGACKYIERTKIEDVFMLISVVSLAWGIVLLFRHRRNERLQQQMQQQSNEDNFWIR